MPVMKPLQPGMSRMRGGGTNASATWRAEARRHLFSAGLDLKAALAALASMRLPDGKPRYPAAMRRIGSAADALTEVRLDLEDQP